jgi:diguanylate cyclase (GGDEF)-like protein
MFKRLQTDFQLGIVLIYGFCAVTLISAFAIYRFITGSVAGGFLDLFLVLSIGTMVVYGWRSGKTEMAGKFLVLLNVVGTTLSTVLLGDTGLYWVFVAISINFFLSWSTSFVAALNILMLLAVMQLSNSITSSVTLWTFLSTGSLLTLLSAIVSRQYRIQNERLQHLATVDPLTGAYNRRNMEHDLQMAVEEFGRNRTPMALLLFDLDHFKVINDHHGHDKGDEVLVQFADLVSGSTRKVDRFFRYGGEEFLLLVKGIGYSEAHALAEKIRHGTENALATSFGKVTVSAGIAGLRVGESYEKWLGRADEALYRAKREGRNRVVVSE